MATSPSFKTDSQVTVLNITEDIPPLSSDPTVSKVVSAVHGRSWKAIGGVVLASGGVVGTVLGGPLGSVIGSLTSTEQLWIAVAFAVVACISLGATLIYNRNHVPAADVKKLVERIKIFDDEVHSLTLKLQSTIDSSQSLVKAMTSGEHQLVKAVNSVHLESEALGSIIAATHETAQVIRDKIPAFETFLEKEGDEGEVLAGRLTSVVKDLQLVSQRGEAAAQSIMNGVADSGASSEALSHLSAEALAIGLRAKKSEFRLEKFQATIESQRESIEAIRHWENTVEQLGAQLALLRANYNRGASKDSENIKGDQEQ